MEKLNLPPYKFKQKTENGHLFIFDRIRKKYVSLTPEEWVRQNMVEFLIDEKRVPPSKIANELTVEYNGMRKRCDSVVFDAKFKPLIIVEYKAPSVAISQKTFDQIAVYNFNLQVRYLMVSNGLNHFFCEVDYETRSYRFFERMPLFETLILPPTAPQ